MSRIILVTGGVRSGKSRFATSIFEGESDVCFLATMIPTDEEMRARIAAHRASRPPQWKTVELPMSPSSAVSANVSNNYILDCVTLLTNNILMEHAPSLENISQEIQNQIYSRAVGEIVALIEKVRRLNGTLVMVTNEAGYSVVPENEAARAFRDILGGVNCEAAALCDEVYLSVCGVQVRVR